MSPAAFRWQKRYSYLAAAGLIALFVGAAAMSVWEKSAPWDDPYHLTAGLSVLQTGDPRLNSDHPPLARLLGALPGFFMQTDPVVPTDREAWERADLFTLSAAYFGKISPRLLWYSHLTMLLLSVLMGGMLYLWGRRLFDAHLALLPLLLFVFCPPFLANAPLITTDMAISTFIFASLFGWWLYLQEPSGRHLTFVSLAVAAAFASKYTSLVLIPLFLLLGTAAVASESVMPFSRERRIRIAGRGLLVIALVTIVTINVVYLFDGVFLTPPQYLARAGQLMEPLQNGAVQLARFWPNWLPVPLPFSYVNGLAAVLFNVGVGGHATYFLGQSGLGGWPNYFLMLLLVKLPIPTLIFIAAGSTLAISRLPRNWWNLLFLLLPPSVLIYLGSTGKMQIGIRHMLPAMPFLFLLAGYTLQGRVGRIRLTAAGVLVALAALSSAMVAPHYLMYFNFLGGGPDRGWRISVAGDDYGQGDADLERWLRERGVRELAFGAFGWGEVILNRAGIRTRPLPCNDNGELAVVHLGQLLIQDRLDRYRCYDWMRMREPDEKIGYSIFIYNSRRLTPQAPAPVEATSPQGPELSAPSGMTAAQHLDLCLDHYNRKRFEAAISSCEKALALKPDFASAHNNICAAYNSMKLWDKAIAACEKGLALDSGSQLLRNNLSWAIQQKAAQRR